ncbi:MAG: phage baseplate assembly protein [Planctomycetaceae bacterium]|nr:phage baseplate assembly protein [Planctomycetaceae bacterium]
MISRNDDTLGQIRRKLGRVISFGKISHYQDDSDSTARTIWGDDQKNHTRIFQHFGFKSKPPAGTDCVGLSSGNLENLNVIATDNKNKRRLSEGETLIYSQEGAEIYLKKDGSIILTAKKINLSCEQFTVKSDTNGELIALISQALELIAGSQIEGQPLAPFASQYPQLAQKLKAFTG